MPPSWTQWTRNPSERSPQRKAFDDILGELRKEGLIEVRSSLFVQLARYAYLQAKTARIEVEIFLKSVPESILEQVPPAYRAKELDATLKILVGAGLATVESDSPEGIVTLLLTERQAPGELARGQEVQTILDYLHEVFNNWDPTDLVTRPSSFPTVSTTIKATGVDRAHLTPGEHCTALDDRPDSNETNPNPLLQETIDDGGKKLVLMQFWPIPDLLLVMPADIPLGTLVRQKCIPVLGAFFTSTDHQNGAAEVQSKYLSYMTKYREKFATTTSPLGDRIDKVLTNADPEGEAFANAVYVVVQVLRAMGRASATPIKGTIVVFQAARIAYAHAMALRVKRRKAEKESVHRTQDAALLVNRLKASNRPLTIDELKTTADVSKNREIGSKYTSVIELLPLTAREGTRPEVLEMGGAFIHRDNLVRTFLELREQEALAQRERLAEQWAKEGIPPVEELYLDERQVSKEFLKALDTVRQERVVAATLQDFLKDYVSTEREVLAISRSLWPDGHKGNLNAVDVVTKGLDPVLYEDKDRLKHRSLVGVLGLAQVYPLMVKNAWNLIFMKDGLVGFLLRKLAAFFGGRGSPKVKEAAVAKAGAGAPEGASKKAKAGAGPATEAAPDPRVQKAAELKRLKSLAPALQNRDSLVTDREKLATQWNLKLDPETARKARQQVDNEIARWAMKMSIDQLSEENSAKVALFLVQKSPILADVTSSKAFNRYLYLTALQKCADSLGK